MNETRELLGVSDKDLVMRVINDLHESSVTLTRLIEQGSGYPLDYTGRSATIRRQSIGKMSVALIHIKQAEDRAKDAWELINSSFPFYEDEG